MKRVFKHLVALFACYSGALYLFDRWTYQRKRGRHLTTLMYHRVLPRSDMDPNGMPGMVTSKESFRQQLKWLRDRHGVLPLAEAVARRRAGEKLPFRAVVITFDDGWKDNHDVAMGPLSEFGLPAIVFVSTGFVESDSVPWFHLVYELLSRGLPPPEDREKIVDSTPGLSSAERNALGHSMADAMQCVETLKRLPTEAVTHVAEAFHRAAGSQANALSGHRLMLSWGQIRALAASRIAIGSHGESHLNLSRLTAERCRSELVGSKARLEEALGTRVTAVAYPNGDYNADVANVARESGYECGCAVHSSRDHGDVDLYALPRIGVHESACLGMTGRFSGALFACLLSGLFRSRTRSPYA